MTRTRISLDGHWDFFIDPEQSLENLDHASTRREILVPGPWQAQFDDLRNYSGVVWYRRSFDLTTDHRPLNTNAGESEIGGQEDSSVVGRRSSVVYVLHFGAVDYHTTVWLNGQLIGEHEGGYLPFELPLDRALRAGSNELVVRVIDPDNDITRFPMFPFSEIPHGKQSWYGPIGGIWQSVYIERRAATHLARLKITPDVAGARVQVQIVLNQPAENPLGLLLTITDPNGQSEQHQLQIAAETIQQTLVLPIPNPLLWDTHTPHLYTLEAALLAEPLSVVGGPSSVVDRLASTFGMRTIATSPDGQLLLNGRILYLRGALDQDYYPELIYTPFSDAELDDQFAKARHMGLNCLRTHIKIADPRYYDAADRAGLLIWTELPNWDNLTEATRRRARATLAGMVERDWNHPSIIIWTIINEGWGLDLALNADHRAWLAETYDYMKQLDPHRLVVGNSACLGNFHIATDIEDFHNYYAIPDHAQQWRDWVRTFAGRPGWTFGHRYGSNEEWRAYLRDPWTTQPLQPTPEVRQRGDEPLLVSEFGNWGLPDVEKLRTGYGGKDPWWFETGQEWGEGVVYPHSVEQRFKAFHLDKVFPSLAELTAASQRMQFAALKYEIEQMRHYPNIVGYVITEFTDVHWESNGLLDMCRNPKVYYDMIGYVNSDDVIVPNVERTTYWEGQRVEVPMALSHFAPEVLEGGRLDWHIDLWPSMNGSFENIAAQPGQLVHIGAAAFVIPQLAQSVRARLELRLFDGQGQPVAANDHEFYAFPRAAAHPSTATIWAPAGLAEQIGALGYQLIDDIGRADAAVVDTITDDMRWYLQAGGRVLWLDASSETQQTMLGGLSICARKGRSWQGDWASSMSWIGQDRMFKHIPSGGLVDFAFAGLTPDHVITGLRTRDFAADVHAGLFVGWVHHSAGLIAERRFGAGRLLISTFRLREQLEVNPIAQIMLGDMIRYFAIGPT
jgi:Glycosyl hydrolases family 2, TIM barrel domain/Glycosyl hydrolases family 2, sugar binding domain/Glycosyl hydrolases family 2